MLFKEQDIYGVIWCHIIMKYSVLLSIKMQVLALYSCKKVVSVHP